jgi:hypothetical protein
LCSARAPSAISLVTPASSITIAAICSETGEYV